jgi:Fic family protein
METYKADNNAAISTTQDRGESIALMEPVVLSVGSKYRGELADLAIELAQASAGFKRSLPDLIVKSLADLVRLMDCYYSNLIEGHDTHPIEIERALKGEYDADSDKRNLQLEAKAHIQVQAWIDQGGLAGHEVTVQAVREIHKRFYEGSPEELLLVPEPQSGEMQSIIPGGFRTRDVQIGRHVPISPGAIPRFLIRYEDVFTRLGKAEMIVAAAAAHHRLTWIHPFLDGNGRVTRLLSHALLLQLLDTGAIWSVSRGLARNETRYKELLANCDLSRRNDLDGRGNLSEEALAEFSKFFLETCLDQVRFMQQLVQPKQLRQRILGWANNEAQAGSLPDKAARVLEALLYRGELPRSEVPNLLGMKERQSRRIVSALIDREVVVSESTRAPLTITFPAKLASSWMPGLFPDRVD